MNVAERRRRRARGLALLGLGGLLAVNALAYFHAGAMVTWKEEGRRTAGPEDLELLERVRVLLGGVSIPRPRNRRTPLDIGLDFETLRFPNDRGEELEAWDVPVEGADVRVVLFHGYAASKESTLGPARAFVQSGCACLLVDFYGSGGSSGSGTTLGIDEADDVRATVAECRRRWPEQRIVLYGQSMGAAAVLRAVGELGVEVDGLVSESSFDRLLTTVQARFRRMGLPGTPLAHVLVFWGSVRIGANGFAHDPIEYARHVTCPALVLGGDHDPNITPDQARAIHAVLAGWKRYSEFPKSGHQDLRLAAPERWLADVGALLEEVRK